MIAQLDDAARVSNIQIYEIEILLGATRPIWRRLQVPGTANLAWLHAVFQVAMGWTNSHLHHFNKETALSTLRYAGYDVVESFYCASLAFSRRAKLAKPIRRSLYKLAPDLAVRLFSGYSLFVLAR